MKVDWPTTRLGELVAIKHGYAFKGAYFSDAPTNDVLVTPGNFAIGGGFKDDKLKFYEGPVQQEYVLNRDDLVVTMTDLSKEADTLGYPALIPDGNEQRYLHNQRVGLVKIKSDEIDKIYLYFLMRTFDYRTHVLGSASGSTVKHTSPSKIESFEFNLPPLEIQEKVGQFLISFENKSLINHQINQTLEEMAQALFKSWFVDFEPVKAKIAARQRWQTLQPENEPSSPVCYAAELNEQTAVVDLDTYMNRAAMQAISGKTAAQLDALRVEDPELYNKLYETAALFPSAMQASELGEIPEGWGAGQLSSFAYLNKESWTKRTIPSEIEYIDLASVKGGIIESTTLYNSEDAPSRAKRKLSEGDTIVGTVRPGNRSFAFIKRSFVGLTGSTGFAVLSPKKEMFSEFVYIAATSDEAIGYLAHLADGGAYPAVRPEVVLNIKSVIPSSLVMDRFHQATRCYFDLSESFKDEGFTLSRTRDALLPKLLSGEIIPVKTDK
ncbi:MAG: restriction endonuclease subunit S [Pseudomonadota bacterium]